ncbi:MAG: hypothetical protein AB8F95_05310 [Bacteroidia bacterium]
MKALIGFLILALLAACSFDQDEEFRPQASGLIILGEAGEGIVVEDAERVAGVSANDVAADRNGKTWYAFPASQVYFGYPEIESQVDLAEIFGDTEGYIPHYITFGTKHLAIVDTVREEVAFFDVKNKGFVHALAIPDPGEIVSLVDKFYVVSEDSVVRVIQEQVFTEIAAITLPASIEAIRLNQDAGLLLLLAGEPARAARIAYLSESLTEPPFNRRNLSPARPCVWKDQYFPPTSRQIFGNEWIAPVALCADSITTSGHSFGAGADQLAVDFFNGISYFSRDSMLYAYRFKTREERIVAPWRFGKFKKVVPYFN